MAKAYHSLTMAGTVTRPAEIVDFLMADFYASLQEQSEIYPGAVASLPYLVATYGSNKMVLSEKIQNTLQKYFSDYFDSVSMNVRCTDIDGTSGYEISLAVEVTQGTETYQLNQLLNVSGTRISKIQDINMNGNIETV
jgi:hypothetical protein